MSQKKLKSTTFSINLPLLPDRVRGWKPYWQFKGPTSNGFWISCHLSVLTQGSCPHPAHKHDEEEILLLLDGHADLILPEAHEGPEESRIRLEPGQFVYYPRNLPHTLECTSDVPANYLMLKWISPTEFNGDNQTMAFSHFVIDAPQVSQSTTNGFHSRFLFENSTKYLRKLHSHITVLEPGGGYPEHSDAHEVVMIMLKGECHTLGKLIKPHDIVYYAAGKPHGIKNVGQDIAVYLVFEFHGNYQKSLWSRIFEKIKVV